MRVLYLTDSRVDYLADSVLHGLIELLGDDVVDYPEKDVLYKRTTINQDYIADEHFPLYGNGFTLYRLLERRQIDRSQINEKLLAGYFDLVIVGSLWKQWNTVMQLADYIESARVVLLDGEDDERSYFNTSLFLKDLCVDTWRLALSEARLVKREWNEEAGKTGKAIVYKAIEAALWMTGLKVPQIEFQISFGIPEEHIRKWRTEKTRLFTRHIVDEEMKQLLGIVQPRHIFDKEADYYGDIQSAKFAVTKKRGGWDCLRHYEIAANRTVICFRDLEKKPAMCAPHGLGVQNCIVYSNAQSLLERCRFMPDWEYEKIEEKSYEWVKSMSTINVVRRMLDNLDQK